MAQASNDSPARKDGAATGAGALRDTAKWLFGGAVATAAGVFAGSTLTNFGQLPLDGRFVIAAAGLLVGFVGIGLLIDSAMKVMTFDAVSFGELASGVPDSPGTEAGGPRLAPPQLVYMRSEIDRMFRTRPSNLPGYAAVFEVWNNRQPGIETVGYFMESEQVVANPGRVAARRGEEPDSVSEADVGELRDFLDAAMHAAQFFKVQFAFTRLRNAMPFYIGLMALGFGSFAWAANPPDPPAREPAIIVNWPSDVRM